MDYQKLALRTGAAVIALAVFLRLPESGAFRPLAAALESPQAMSMLVYLQTGRAVGLAPTEAPPATTQPTMPQPTATQAPPETTAPPEAGPVQFVSAEAEGLSMIYGCDYRPDIPALLTQELNWDLQAQEPTVLIVHTHATECYTGPYSTDGSYHTGDDDYNMVSIGDEVAKILEAGGISVIHDRSHHDEPSYNNSYVSARAAIEDYLEQYPSIQLVLDLHRDASGGDGGQLTTCGTVGGQPASQLMIIVGTDATGRHHPNWRENLALGLKLAAVLERSDPGLTRGVQLSENRYNTDETPGSLLIEVGAAGDSHEQALLAAHALARAVLTLANGAQ